MAVDPSEAVNTPVDDLADLEIDEYLLHLSSDDDGDSEEEKAVQAAPPAPTPAAAAGRGRVRSDKSSRGAHERPGWQGVARCPGARPEVCVGDADPTSSRRAPVTRARRPWESARGRLHVSRTFSRRRSSLLQWARPACPSRPPLTHTLPSCGRSCAGAARQRRGTHYRPPGWLAGSYVLAVKPLPPGWAREGSGLCPDSECKSVMWCACVTCRLKPPEECRVL